MKQKSPWIHYGILFVIYAVATVTLLTHTFFHTLVHGEENSIVYKAQPCSHVGSTHTILIQGNAFIPDKLNVQRCDTVEFENRDKNTQYLPSLGDHPHDIIYAGFKEQTLGYNQKESFVAHTAGMFKFHDHIKDQIEGMITITR